MYNASHFSLIEAPTQKHTQSMTGLLGQDPRGRTECRVFARVFEQICIHFGLGKNCNSKTHGFGTFSLFSLHVRFGAFESSFSLSRSFLKHFLVSLFSHLRRGGFRYTTIGAMHVLMILFSHLRRRF